MCEQQCQTKVESLKPNYDFCQVDLKKYHCNHFFEKIFSFHHQTKVYVHNKAAGKCVQLNACCEKFDEINGKLFYDERDCERFCHREDQSTSLAPPNKCEGEDLDTCSDWHTSCNHSYSMYVFDKADQRCKKLKYARKCCPYGRYLFKNVQDCQCKCHGICAVGK